MNKKVIIPGAIRGRPNSNGSFSQKLETHAPLFTNTITTVQKDLVRQKKPLR